MKIHSTILQLLHADGHDEENKFCFLEKIIVNTPKICRHLEAGSGSGGGGRLALGN
jgi:hypothetical protein